MVENCIGLQMLRIIISIFIFISPVIFCENERSDHFESPETAVYRLATIDLLLIAGAGWDFHSKCAFHLEGKSFTSNIEDILKSFKLQFSSKLFLFFCIAATVAIGET